jgi:hypothetical protein
MASCTSLELFTNLFTTDGISFLVYSVSILDYSTKCGRMLFWCFMLAKVPAALPHKRHSGNGSRLQSRVPRSHRGPEILSSLIAAANDGAKSAQTGALAFTLVGLYLVASAFSTTDEDLLLEHTVSVSQIGVQVPVFFSLAIAPAVLLFLHVYTLIRYDMLAANLRQTVARQRGIRAGTDGAV